MSKITAKAVSELRAKTGCGMMDCKKALVDANGDFEEAIKLLRERGLAVAAKKADRIAAEGIVDILTSEDGKTAAMLEVNSETDFVAKNADFREFVRGVLRTILANEPADMDALMACKFDGSDTTVEQALNDKIFTIRENLSIRRFVIVKGAMSTYIHGGGETGVIVKFDADDEVAAKPEFAEMAKNVALQVAAMNCQYTNRSDVPQSVMDEEKEILITQIKNDPKNANKPQEIIEKMVTGRLEKFYENNVLADQSYVKDDSMTVAQYVESVAKEIGPVKLHSFYRYDKGEGLQKREDNFAEEIANMVSGNKD
ncbi:MAG: translation elongation factor Ts [Eubacteriales bacterium]|jgi:elongation factor Ts|nr:elongation factor Ts [Clostridiales bacterium]